MRSIGPKIWVEEVPFKLGPAGNIGGRMTVVQLASGELMIISPVRPNPQTVEELKKLGPVAYLIGPNSTHHLYLSTYHQEFPQAQIAGPRKLQKRKKSVSFQITLDEIDSLPWKNEVDTQIVDSPGMMSEAVFFHRASRTLILTDLVFNLQKADSRVSAIFLKLNNALGKLTMTNIAKLAWKDRRGLKRDIETISRWDFDQIVMAHGEIVAKSGKDRFLKCFAWLKP